MTPQMLVAEDDPVSRRMLVLLLGRWGFDPVVVEDGETALVTLRSREQPWLALLDWMMPRLDGARVCREIEASGLRNRVYTILVTALGGDRRVAEGLEAGADDYVQKPFQPVELRARIQAGLRVLNLQQELVAKIGALEAALDQIQTLHGILPICMHCHRIRRENEAWQRIEAYIQEHSDATFTHGLCPECLEKHYPQK